jgi:ESCRT-I complex subunit TSG101
MDQALSSLRAEHHALTTLAATLSANEAILHSAMKDADACIARAAHTSVPDVDAVLVAPTVVGGQVYDLVAEEEASIRAREVLAKALDKGRIGVETWVRHTRALARDEFLKKWLARKAGWGMGMVVDS